MTSVERRRCSNEAKMRNPLKFAGVPQTRQPISAVSEPKFAILRGHVEDVLLFNKYFFPIVGLKAKAPVRIYHRCNISFFYLLSARSNEDMHANTDRLE